MNLEKLVKLLNLTQSEWDNEAITAIRIANNLLKKEGFTWGKLLLKSTPKAPITASSDSGYEQMIAFCLKYKPENEFLLSLEKWVNEKKFLTDKQKDALVKIYGSIRGKQ